MYSCGTPAGRWAWFWRAVSGGQLIQWLGNTQRGRLKAQRWAGWDCQQHRAEHPLWWWLWWLQWWLFLSGALAACSLRVWLRTSSIRLVTMAMRLHELSWWQNRFFLSSLYWRVRDVIWGGLWTWWFTSYLLPGQRYSRSLWTVHSACPSHMTTCFFASWWYVFLLHLGRKEHLW